MQTVLNLVETWCESYSIVKQTSEDRVSFMVEGANSTFQSDALVLEEARAFVCICAFATFVAKEKRAEVAVQLVDINYTLSLGAIQLNSETGELSLRATHLLPADDNEASMVIDRAITSTASVMDKLTQPLMKLCCV